MSTFRESAFRSTTGTQYADQLWLRNIGTIATPSTYGETESLRVGYLEDGDGAIPSLFGSLLWKAPTSEPAQCEIKVSDGFDLVTALSVNCFETAVNGSLAVNGPGIVQGSLTVNGPVYFPFISQVPSSGSMLTWDQYSGEISYVPMTGAFETIGELATLTITDEFSLPNLLTIRTAYNLCVEPMTGVVYKAETPYSVTTVDGAIADVSFSANVVLGNVSATTLNVSGDVEAGNVIQVGSGSDVWRLKPDPGSGSLAVQKLEGGVWVTKSLIGGV